MVRVCGDGLCEEWNIWRDDRVMAGLDRDFSPIVTPVEAHFAFGYFQPSVMASRDETEICAHDDGFGLRCHEDKRTLGHLRLQYGLHRSVVQLHAKTIFA